MLAKLGVLAVTALVIGGSVAVVMYPFNDRGWYLWDPTVGDIDYSKISATPRIIDAIEEIYGIVYGDLPAPATGATIDFEPLVTQTADGVFVKSAGTGAGIPSETLFFTNDMISSMKIISYGLGFTDTFVQILGDSVWDTVVAAGNSTWNAYPDNGMRWETLTTEMSLSTLKLLSFLESGAYERDSTYCLVVWGYITNYSAVKEAIAKGNYGNVMVLCIDYYETIRSLENLLAVVDALGWIVGKGTDNKALVNFQERLCAIVDELSSETRGLKVYMELAAGTSPGADTLSQLCFDVLRLKNINETSGTKVLNDVNVVASAPDIILFDKRDPRTMEKKMRLA